MSVKIFKGNSRNSGAVATFNFGPSERGGNLNGEISLYISILLQASWNEQTKRPSFKENAKDPSKNLRIKFSEFEVGSLINSFKRRVEFKAYHTHAGRQGQVQISLTPSTKDNVFQGFILSCLRDGKEKFAITIGAGEAENVASFLDFGLKTLYAYRHRTQFDGFKKNEGQQNSAAKPATKPAAPAEEADPFAGEADTPVQTEENSGSAAGAEADENPFG